MSIRQLFSQKVSESSVYVTSKFESYSLTVPYLATCGTEATSHAPLLAHPYQRLCGSGDPDQRPFFNVELVVWRPRATLTPQLSSHKRITIRFRLRNKSPHVNAYDMRAQHTSLVLKKSVTPSSMGEVDACYSQGSHGEQHGQDVEEE